MNHRVRTGVGLFILAIILVAGLWRFPAYPSTKSLCLMIKDREQISDRWASPHRGALFVATGVLHGAQSGVFAFECNCGGVRPLIGVSPPGAWLGRAPEWKALGNRDVMRTETSVKIAMLARVESEEQSCFGPGMVVRPLVVTFRGPVQRARRAAK